MLVQLDPYQSENMLAFMKNRLLLKAPHLFPDGSLSVHQFSHFFIYQQDREKKIP